ncbi:hypothetical protein VNO78_03791 [Psophocarpus tetragonolobus]|uniref:Uncharacterized protein n=1 Tax=Psophocarpus tetragonolobus TaxID=3891 RepID=A0AAN9XX08_PSOTE
MKLIVRESLKSEQLQYWDRISQRKGTLVKRQNGGAKKTPEGDKNENVKIPQPPYVVQWEKARGGNMFEYGVCVKIGELLDLLFLMPFSMLLQFSRKFLERKMFLRYGLTALLFPRS